ncbi:hypothetical protein P152DRAFT_483229 [Eremomyces bilateralis CBS 781.70]|uniref:Uncharacterized protein n=1 Tax=Eremomyces bilateralis CBS 781.70 TaxID=1392243 RepID=A0A6G1FZZ2_9PEZI|nr:uncharacterized protein P152DRAFT_483229 [Eremomyces bilateralis CBS 781.70]KAF1811353.1 hypothetical protein P152DRAFT_483229 [Eremomyces bilateralis CBS 781.70]
MPSKSAEASSGGACITGQPEEEADDGSPSSFLPGQQVRLASETNARVVAWLEAFDGPVDPEGAGGTGVSSRPHPLYNRAQRRLNRFRPDQPWVPLRRRYNPSQVRRSRFGIRWPWVPHRRRIRPQEPVLYTPQPVRPWLGGRAAASESWKTTTSESGMSYTLPGRSKSCPMLEETRSSTRPARLRARTLYNDGWPTQTVVSRGQEQSGT